MSGGACRHRANEMPQHHPPVPASSAARRPCAPGDAPEGRPGYAGAIDPLRTRTAVWEVRRPAILGDRLPRRRNSATSSTPRRFPHVGWGGETRVSPPHTPHPERYGQRFDSRNGTATCARARRFPHGGIPRIAPRSAPSSSVGRGNPSPRPSPAALRAANGPHQSFATAHPVGKAPRTIPGTVRAAIPATCARARRFPHGGIPRIAPRSAPSSSVGRGNPSPRPFPERYGQRFRRLVRVRGASPTGGYRAPPRSAPSSSVPHAPRSAPRREWTAPEFRHRLLDPEPRPRAVSPSEGPLAPCASPNQRAGPARPPPPARLRPTRRRSPPAGAATHPPR